MRGLQWSILNVDKKSLKVNVEPFVGKSKVPYWEGENIPVDYITANTVGKLRTKVKEGSVKLSNKLIQELNFDIIPKKYFQREKETPESIIASNEVVHVYLTNENGREIIPVTHLEKE